MNSVIPYVIALYIRLSTEDSKVGSFSIDNQKRVLHQYVDTMEGIKNIEVMEFIDNGYSGTNFERPAVQELLDLVREGKINCIIVKDFTRFGRNSIEVGYFMERIFPIYGIRFISINDDFDSDKLHGDTGGINVAFKYLISEFYSRDLSMKYKSAKYVKFRHGEYQSKICPYGYRKGSNGRMEPDEETAPNVRLIFELARDGADTSHIIEELFHRGIPTPSEHKATKGESYNNNDISRCCGIWIRSTILRMLGDERYADTYIMGKREVTEVGGRQMRLKDESKWFKIPDHHPAIVSRELFEQAQSQLLHFKSRKKNVNIYPLRKKVFCGCCRHAMPRTANKNHSFLCRYTQVDKTSPCYGLRIGPNWKP
ncbi:MAG: recombinase family protein [Oscillospiraceae bacterium]|nr:recombinase family protein [Oscillospiraceae bacterium]